MSPLDLVTVPAARRVGPALMALLALMGCASTSPDYEARLGEAVRQNLAAQVINPRAADAPDTAQGQDGGTAREAVQRYRDSFKSPPPVVNVINIGSAR